VTVADAPAIAKPAQPRGPIKRPASERMLDQAGDDVELSADKRHRSAAGTTVMPPLGLPKMELIDPEPDHESADKTSDDDDDNHDHDKKLEQSIFPKQHESDSDSETAHSDTDASGEDSPESDDEDGEEESDTCIRPEQDVARLKTRKSSGECWTRESEAYKRLTRTPWCTCGATSEYHGAALTLCSESGPIGNGFADLLIDQPNNEEMTIAAIFCPRSIMFDADNAFEVKDVNGFDFLDAEEARGKAVDVSNAADREIFRSHTAFAKAELFMAAFEAIRELLLHDPCAAQSPGMCSANALRARRKQLITTSIAQELKDPERSSEEQLNAVNVVLTMLVVSRWIAPLRFRPSHQAVAFPEQHITIRKTDYTYDHVELTSEVLCDALRCSRLMCGPNTTVWTPILATSRQQVLAMQALAVYYGKRMLSFSTDHRQLKEHYHESRSIEHDFDAGSETELKKDLAEEERQYNLIAHPDMASKRRVKGGGGYGPYMASRSYASDVPATDSVQLALLPLLLDAPASFWTSVLARPYLEPFLDNLFYKVLRHHSSSNGYRTQPSAIADGQAHLLASIAGHTKDSWTLNEHDTYMFRACSNIIPGGAAALRPFLTLHSTNAASHAGCMTFE